MTENKRNITARQAYDWITSGEAILIDVRESDEFKAEHIPYALSIPLGKIAQIFTGLEIPQGKKVVFQCLRGMRGAQACAVIGQKNEGCDVYNLEGGISGWKDAGYAIVSSEGGSASGLTIFRQVQMIVGLLVLAFVSLGLLGQSWGFMAAGILGGLLAFAGLSGWCGLAMLLAKAPWNRTA